MRPRARKLQVSEFENLDYLSSFPSFKLLQVLCWFARSASSSPGAPAGDSQPYPHQGLTKLDSKNDESVRDSGTLNACLARPRVATCLAIGSLGDRLPGPCRLRLWAFHRAVVEATSTGRAWSSRSCLASIWEVEMREPGGAD